MSVVVLFEVDSDVLILLVLLAVVEEKSLLEGLSSSTQAVKQSVANTAASSIASALACIFAGSLSVDLLAFICSTCPS